jgi:hypothetical protein
MDVSLLFGVALGVCIGMAFMSLVVYRTPQQGQVAGERVAGAVIGVVDPSAPRRRRNKHPRRHDTPEEVQPVPNLETSLT